MASTKKPTPAQLAARKKFAAMAKSGALARLRKKSGKHPRKTARAKNPVPAKRTDRKAVPAAPATSRFRYHLKIDGKVLAGANTEKEARGIGQWLADLYGKQAEMVSA